MAQKSYYEEPEGIYNQFEYLPNGDLYFYYSGALSVTEIETFDLISEGEIEGLVTGEFYFKGTAGNLGWDSYQTELYDVAPKTENVRYLKSIYYNQVPILNSANQYNFQSIVTDFSFGSSSGAVLNATNNEITISKTLNERLRSSVAQMTNDNSQAIGTSDDNAKYYVIYNKECKAAIINIKIINLSQTNQSKNSDGSPSSYFGDLHGSKVRYNIYYRPIFSKYDNKIGVTESNLVTQSFKQTEYFWVPPISKSSKSYTETVQGKISQGFIRKTRINFNQDFLKNSDFIGWEIKVVRPSSSPDSTTSLIRNQTSIDSVTEIYDNSYLYPNSAIVYSKFSAEYFSQIPERAFDTRGIKVKIPNNYDPIKRIYAGSWDGTFNTSLYWTDNPAWCFYDLLTNERYGLGKYIDTTKVDKITLYEIGKYCDYLIEDGFGHLEPRFTCNLLISSKEDAFKVVNDMASIFNGITYYAGNSIFAAQDALKEPLTQFTNVNIQDGNFNYSSSSKKARHTVAIIRYNNKYDNFKPAIEYVEDVEGIRKYGYRELELSAFGCTSRGQATRLGRWALITENTETETINFEGGLECSLLRPGDVFKVYDYHKKMTRLCGRLYDIQNISPTHTIITLDDNITTHLTNSNTSSLGGDDNLVYNFSLLTPTYLYDPTLISNLTSTDAANIRKPQLQSKIFDKTYLTTTNNRTVIDFNSSFNTTDYNVTGNLVWIIENATGVSNYTGYFQYLDSGFDYYRVINVVEKEITKYEVVGLQYNSLKYLQIDSGINYISQRKTNIDTPSSPLQMTLKSKYVDPFSN